MKQAVKSAPITLKAVAQTVNCSVAAVSTVLNGSKGNTAVGEEMKKKIMETAAQMGYRPNFASRILKQRCSKTLGIYVQPNLWRSISNNYEMLIFKGIEQAARERSYDLLLLNMSTQVMPKVCVDQLAESRIDGIILLHADPNAGWVDELIATGSPVVAVDCCAKKAALSRVVFDNEAAIFLALQTLIKLGHSRIGFAGNCATSEPVEDISRDHQFARAVAKLNLPVGDELIFNQKRCFPPITNEIQYCQAEGAAALRYFAAMAQPPTAIIAYNSLVGVSIIHEAQRLKIDIPGKFSLIGIDDYEYLQFVRPNLTVIDHVLPEMGHAGAKLLIDLIERKVEAPACQVFQPRLIMRESAVKICNN